MALAALACAITVPVIPPQALGDGMPPWLVCFNNKEATELSTPHLAASPANGATVLAGIPVTLSGQSFSGESSYALTFSVASSPALLSSPDIDSGLGSLQPGTSLYTFTSAKAAATPRTIYWAASFTFTPGDCEGPSTFTTPVRTLTVVSPPPTEAELAAKKKQEEEAAAKKKSEEETPAGTAGASKPKVKSLTRAQRVAAALEACHKKGHRHRVVCERQARKRFGQADKTKKK
ncbi:MAG: hypothetical protein ACHQCH_00555 [Solirubrobacterales bacterium]